MKITWLTQGGFLFEANSVRILVDPYMSNFLESKGLKRLVKFPIALAKLKPDVLICTHDHLDHLDPETVLRISKEFPNCKIMGPESCYSHYIELGIDDRRCEKLSRNILWEFKGFKITPVSAFHSDPHSIGLVIEADGSKYYLSGDTIYSEELINDDTKNCDVVLICINGRMGNMNTEEALEIVKAIKPNVALPMHYGLFAENTADPQLFIKKCKKQNIKSFAMLPGVEFSI